jgi:signal transduction histidine kinase
MRDRVEALGGWLLVTSRIGRGTLVSGWVPNASSLPHFDRT